MGIRGLGGWIRWAARHTIEQPNWEDWRGKRIGIDILGLLYNAKARRQCPFEYIGRLIAACHRYDISILPIFDGKAPNEKTGTIQHRIEMRNKSQAKQTILENDLETIEMSVKQRFVIETELDKLRGRGVYFTSEERELAKQIFYACGIVSLNASGEADSVLAYFAKRNVFHGILSNDFDLLARGVETLLVPEWYALPGDKSGWSQYSLTNILRSVDFQYDQFLEMAVLMGSDYSFGKKAMPYKSAYWAIKYGGPMEYTLAKLHIKDISKYMKAKELLSGQNETKESLMGTKQWEKLEVSAYASEPDALHILRNTYLKNLDESDFHLLFRQNV
jgi:5'-3' exonuclease